MTRARAALGGAPPGGSYRQRAGAAAHAERDRAVPATADRDQLIAAVESVQAQDEPVGQIVLVIDHHDGLQSKARERWPTLTVEANAGPQGLSAARNTGIEASSGDIVLFLDDDAVADPDWSRRLTAPYADPAILGVGGSAQPVWQGRFLLEPKASVHHAVPAERTSWPCFRARCRAEGISRARVARNVGRTAALSAESAYVRRVLPIGVLHNLGRGLRGDLAALARAGAIVAGLAFTATGFLKIRWTRPAGPPQEVGSTLRNFSTGADAEPVLLLVIDLNSPLAAIDARRAGQQPRASALCPLTRDGHPVTKVRLHLPEAVLDGDQIDAQLPVGHQTARHHRAGAAGSRHHAEWLRGFHPAIGQPPGQHAASGPAGRHPR